MSTIVDLHAQARAVVAWLKSLQGMISAFPVVIHREHSRREGGRSVWPGALYFQRLKTPADSGAPAAGRSHVSATLYLLGVPPNVRPGKSFGGKSYTHTRNTAYLLSGDVGKLGGWAKKEWFLGGYYTPAAVASKERAQFKEFHPFGANFMLMPWRVPTGEPIDQYARKPYQREKLQLQLVGQVKANPWGGEKSAVPFFIKNAGTSYDPKRETESQGRLRGARDLAKAESWASSKGYSFQWEQDSETDSSDFSDEKPAWSLWVCSMRDPAGKVVQSLGGMGFGRDRDPWMDPYRRVVEAELALEEMPGESVKSNPYPGEHAARLVEPRGFVRVRRQQDKFGPGIHAIFGIRAKAGPRGGRVVLQAIRFDARRFSAAEAKAWLRKFKETTRVLSFEPARGSLAKIKPRLYLNPRRRGLLVRTNPPRDRAKPDSRLVRSGAPVPFNQLGVKPGPVKLAQFRAALAYTKTPALRSQDGLGQNAIAYVKLFNPSGAATWWITEWDPATNEAFGWADLGDPQSAELGYMDLRELATVPGPFGIGIELDNWFRPGPLAQVKKNPVPKGIRPENRRMQAWLSQQGIQATPKYIMDGSLRGTWRLYNKEQRWTTDLAAALNRLGFVDNAGNPLGPYSGNGGVFSVFVRGHNELLHDVSRNPWRRAKRGGRARSSKSHRGDWWIICYDGPIGKNLYVSSYTEHKVRLVENRARAKRFPRRGLFELSRKFNRSNRGRFVVDRP